MSTTLLAPGFADPSHDAQRLFRGVLDAFSHPGRIVELRDAPAGPGTLSPAATAFLLTFAGGDFVMQHRPLVATQSYDPFQVNSTEFERAIRQTQAGQEYSPF